MVSQLGYGILAVLLPLLGACGDSAAGGVPQKEETDAGAQSGAGPFADTSGARRDAGAEQAHTDAAHTQLRDASLGGADARANDAGDSVEAALDAAALADAGSGTADAGTDAAGFDEAPSVFVIADVGTPPGIPFVPFIVHFYDDITVPAELLITAKSSNETFLPSSGIVFGPLVDEGEASAGHSYRELTLTPSTLAAGSAIITIEVQDTGGNVSQREFEASVLALPLNAAEAVSVTGGPTPVLGSSDSYSGRPALSADGKIVAFESNADNFGAGSSAYLDIYVRDRSAKTTTRITPGLGQSERPSISANGRYLAFYSTYPLVADDTNAVADCYLFDRQTSTFERVSVSSIEAQANAASLPGKFEDSRPALSDDGRYVAFVSAATNLVATDENAKIDVFVRDRVAGTTARVSVSSSGVEGDGDSGQPSMSSDGSVVAFSSRSKTLQDGMSDVDDRLDVFVRTAGITQRISRAHGTLNAANGMSDHPSLSGDGSILAFASAATNLGASIDLYGHTDIWLFARSTQTLTRVNTDLDPTGSQGYCSGPSLSQDGKLLVFSTQGYIDDFLSDAAQTYTYATASGVLKLASRNQVGSVPNAGSSYESVISRDGTAVAFQTAASNIVFGDTNSNADVFIVPF